MIGSTAAIKQTKQDFVPVNEPLFIGNEKKYLNECIDSGWISSDGPFVKKFEEQFAATVGRRYGVAVCNGTAALEVAVQVLGLGSGDEVIMPTFTIISCAAAIVKVGATPVVVDCHPDTWNMDLRQIEEKITKKTKAIMVVHIYGLPVDMYPVLELANKYNLKIVEDSAEAIGQSYKNKPCGSFGDVSVFSFYANKHITTGEGGMLVVDDAELVERCRSFRNLCFQAKQRFVHEEIGSNFRMTNLQAAVGLAQLENLNNLVVRKREIGRLYNQAFKGISKLKLPLPKTDYAENIYWIYGLVLGDDVTFDAKIAMQMLAKKGIGVRPFFWNMHEQPVFKKMGLFERERCPVAEKIARRGFYIPSGLGLTQVQQERVIEAIKETFG
jgi:perosamine synthetase